MANVFDTPTLVAQTALATLYKSTVLGRLVWTDFFAGMTPGSGSTISIPKPAVLTAHTFATGTAITLDDATESSVNVTVNQNIYSAVGIPDLDATLNIRNFQTQILGPQVMAVAQAVEGNIAALFNGLPATTGTGAANADIVNASALVGVTKARTALTKQNVSTSNRVVVASPDFIESLISDPNISQVNQAGSGDALVDGFVARVRGFDVYESNFITAGAAYAFVQEALAYVSFPPLSPRGATASEVVHNDQGLALRWLSDYDTAFLRDRSVVNVLAGGAVMDNSRVVRMRLS